MNYLAHVFLAQPTSESVCGNLMGDFMKGVRIESLPEPIALGVHNHRLVDRFTDSHDSVRQLKFCLSQPRRRFSGIISDVMFDHLLIQHWHQFSGQPFDVFVWQAYQRMEASEPYMNARMKQVTSLMREQNWLQEYSTLEGVERVLERMSRRIRFENTLSGCMQEVKPALDHYQHAFLKMFPQLVDTVEQAAIESMADALEDDHRG